jgi:spermidine/putrescine transport system substrate-binding protein
MAPEQAKAAAQQKIQYLVNTHGFTPDQAATMVGTLYQESKFNPTATHDGGTGYGLGGWRLERRDALIKEAQAKGEDPANPTTQLDFYANEFKTRPEFQKFPLHWFDDKLYAVMTDFGYLGLSYNTEVYKPEEVSSYAAMWEPKATGKVGFFDWYLPSMGCISLSNGNRPPFDIDEAAFEAVKEKLFSLKPQTAGFYTIADIFSSLRNGQAHLIPGIGEWVTLGLRLDGAPVDTILPAEGGIQWTESMSIVKGTPKADLARKFIQYTTSPAGQVAMATKADNKKSIPSIKGWELLNSTMPDQAEFLRLQLDKRNVMDDWKVGRVALRQLPQQQAIEDWNDVWSEMKSL